MPTPMPSEPGTLWPVATGGKYHVVPVCFTAQPHTEWNRTPRCSQQKDGQHACDGSEFKGTTTDALRARVRALVEDTWQRYSTVEFRDFSDCSSDTSNGFVKITFMTRGAAPEPLTETVTGAGWHSDYPTDVHLDWAAIRDGAPEDLRRVLREFGHALGIPYEYLNRTPQGTVIACNGLATDPALPLVAVPTGLRDSGSIMNRCGAGGNGPFLSPMDVAAIQDPGIYGRKPPGYIVGYRGRCIDILDRRPDFLTPVVASSCDYASDYYWTLSGYENQPQFFTSVGPSGWRCMDAYGATTGDLTSVPVLANQCLTAPSQSSAFNQVEWKLGGFCIGAIDGAAPRLQVQPCDGSAPQKWNFWSHDPQVDWTAIRTADGACVTAGRREDAGADELTLKPCALGDASQSMVPGIGLSTADGRHVVLEEGVLREGALLTLSDSGIGAPVFSVSGPIHLLDRCLSISGGQGDPKDAIDIEPCAPSNRAQRFEFYW